MKRKYRIVNSVPRFGSGGWIMQKFDVQSSLFGLFWMTRGRGLDMKQAEHLVEILINPIVKEY